MNKEKSPITLLFLCTGNSCRSQIAEAWARHLKSPQIEAYSAGVAPKGMDTRAMAVMQECGVDLSHHHSKHLDELAHIRFDFVITVCGHAHETCPIFPGATQVTHVGFEDPPHLAQSAKSEEEALGIYRRVRDEIRDFVNTLPEVLIEKKAAPQKS